MICEVCGTEFIHSKMDKTTCSNKCRDKKYYAEHKAQKKEYYKKYYVMHKGEEK